MTDKLIISKKNDIAMITFHDPPMNLLTAQLTSECFSALENIEQDDSVHAVIITGSGEKAFMAGADINEFISEDAIYRKTLSIQQLFNKLENIPKCTIALLNGYTLGGGMELALCCDFRIAESHVKLGFPEVKLGLLPAAGGTQRLTRLIGISKAKELLFTGETISAHEALNLGIVNKVVEKGNGEKAAMEIAERIAALPKEAIAKIKRLVNRAHDTPLLEGLELELNQLCELYKTENAKEGILAFKEKRKPIFNK